MGKQRRQFNAGFKAKVALKAWTPTSDDFYLLRASRFYRKMGVHGFTKEFSEKEQIINELYDEIYRYRKEAEEKRKKERGVPIYYESYEW